MKFFKQLILAIIALSGTALVVMLGVSYFVRRSPVEVVSSLPATTENSTTSTAAATSTPEVSSTSSDEVATWSLSDPAIGFSIRLPDAWKTIQGPSIQNGPNPGHEREFWRDILGKIYLGHEHFVFEVVAKRSAMTPGEWLAETGRADKKFSESAGFLVFRDQRGIHHTKTDFLDDYAWGEEVTVYYDGIFYVIDFQTWNFKDRKDVEEMKRLWEKAFDTLELSRI